ncbi:MAG: ABC transporter permease subunit [Caldilineales bacterium]|nr:ABC transporter permease subunit [Caldilineales bacterium]
MYSNGSVGARQVRRRLSPEAVARGRLLLALAPALAVVVFLFLGGWGLGLAGSLGYQPWLDQTQLSLAAYTNLLGRSDFLASLGLTLWIASVSTALSSVLALAGALFLRRLVWGRRWATFAFQLNLPIPHSVGAIAMLLLLGQSGFLARLGRLAGLIETPADFPALIFDPLALGVILEYSWKATTFIGVNVLAALLALGEDYEATARTLGAGAWQRLRRVVLPLVSPSLAAAAVLSFAFAFGAFEAPFLLGQRYPSALPVLAYRSYVDVDLNARPEAMAISMVITAVTTLAVLLYMRFARRRAV